MRNVLSALFLLFLLSPFLILGDAIGTTLRLPQARRFFRLQSELPRDGIFSEAQSNLSTQTTTLSSSNFSPYETRELPGTEEIYSSMPLLLRKQGDALLFFARNNGSLSSYSLNQEKELWSFTTSEKMLPGPHILDPLRDRIYFLNNSLDKQSIRIHALTHTGEWKDSQNIDLRQFLGSDAKKFFSLKKNQPIGFSCEGSLRVQHSNNRLYFPCRIFLLEKEQAQEIASFMASTPLESDGNLSSSFGASAFVQKGVKIQAHGSLWNESRDQSILAPFGGGPQNLEQGQYGCCLTWLEENLLSPRNFSAEESSICLNRLVKSSEKQLCNTSSVNCEKDFLPKQLELNGQSRSWHLLYGNGNQIIVGERKNTESFPKKFHALTLKENDLCQANIDSIVGLRLKRGENRIIIQAQSTEKNHLFYYVLNPEKGGKLRWKKSFPISQSLHTQLLLLPHHRNDDHSVVLLMQDQGTQAQLSFLSGKTGEPLSEISLSRNSLKGLPLVIDEKILLSAPGEKIYLLERSSSLSKTLRESSFFTALWRRFL